MGEYLRWVVSADNASLQQGLAVLKARTESERLQKFTTLYAATNDPHLREAGTEQAGQVLRASMAVHTYAA